MGIVDQVISALRPIRFRGKGRLLGNFIRNSGIRRAKVFGCEVELDLEDLIQRMVYLGTYEQEEAALVSSYLKPGMTFVDVGANVGFYTLLAASRVGPDGRVIAFEPSPYAAERLEKTVAANRLQQVQVIRAGLGSREGETLLYTPLPGNHTPSMLGESGSPAVSVPIMTLDACMSDLGVEAVDLLKIDVEGYEPLVLAGSVEALAAGRIRAVLCEFNDYWLNRAGTDARGLYQTLLAAGFVDTNAGTEISTGGVATRLLIYRPTQTLPGQRLVEVHR